MINLLNNCAVPLGYTTDFESEYQCTDNELCSIIAMTEDVMNRRYLRNPYGLEPTLPDVVLSTGNTPPASPLRRAHSYNFLFPEKSDHYRGHQFIQRPFSVLPTPPPTPTSPQDERQTSMEEGMTPPSSSTLGRDENDPDVDNARTGLGHIQEVRRRLGNPVQFQPHQSLPQLTWEVPRIQRARRNTGPPQRESDQRLRQIGADLRRIADQFQLDNGKATSNKKGDSSRNSSWAVPAALTRCLSVAILGIVWWRVLNKFR